MERKNIWSAYTPEQIAELDNISTRYKSCLNEGKTERECVELSNTRSRVRKRDTGI